MSNFVVETFIKNGELKLHKIPFKDNTKVKVVLIPKVKLAKMSFAKVRRLTKGIKGNLSDDITEERYER